MSKISFSQAIAILKEKFQEARDSEYVSKPISWALYQTWQKVDVIEERRPVSRVGGQKHAGGKPLPDSNETTF